MTTALIISELLLPIHDDALIADIDAVFDEIDREIAETRALAQQAALLLDVEWLVDEMLEDDSCRGFGDAPKHPPQILLRKSGGPPEPSCDPAGHHSGEPLEISLTLTEQEAAPACDEVAEVA
ncbi:MAG TPA: hypothetical protein VK034_15935 [Enhygromyxa sp.]|nr:hypothetical protein [Enhygromyxa sp.]